MLWHAALELFRHAKRHGLQADEIFAAATISSCEKVRVKVMEMAFEGAKRKDFPWIFHVFSMFFIDYHAFSFVFLHVWSLF